MTLTLRAVSLNDLPLTQPITAQFDAQGGTIGRADHNTMALPDPERHISRRQAEISAGRQGYVIKNIGSANPIVVRNRPLAQGESAPLAHSDQVRIGGYLLEVVDDAASADATTIGSGRADAGGLAAGLGAPRTGPPGAAPGVGDFGRPLSRTNPFAELLAESLTPSKPSAAAPATPAPAPARLPDDFDPFAPPARTPAAAPAPSASASVPRGAFDDLLPPATSSIDELFGLKDDGARDPLADFLAGTPVAPAATREGAGGGLSTDPLELFGAPAAPAPPPEFTPDRTPERRAAFLPPQPAARAAAAERAAPPAAPPFADAPPSAAA